MKQERYHEWLKRKFEETRHELGSDRQYNLEHSSGMEWIRIRETGRDKDSIKPVQLDGESNKKSL